MTHSPFSWRNPLDKLREQQQLIPYSRQLNDILWWGNLLHVPIYCRPKKNNKQVSWLFPFLSYSEQQILLFHHAHSSCERNGFCKLKGRTDRKGKYTSFLLFSPISGGGGGVWSGRAGDFADFRCGSRTLWFLTSQTLCFPTLGWILSPWILYPRWACTRFFFFCALKKATRVCFKPRHCLLDVWVLFQKLCMVDVPELSNT